MRTRGKVALGGTMASAATMGWLVAAGAFATTATLVVTDPLAPPANAEADELTAFEDCTELLDWYVTHGVRDVGPYGWNGGPVYLADLDSTARLTPQVTASDAGAAEPASGSATGTNTQESDVDEPDIAKTDGTLVARIVEDTHLVLIDVSGTDPVVTARYRLPDDGYGAELLLVGDRVLVTQQVFEAVRLPSPESPGDDRAWIERSSMPWHPGSTGSVRVLDLDIADPSAPRLLRKDVYSGTLTSARLYGDTIRLVTTTGRPELDWVTPTKAIPAAEATRRNQALVRATTIEDWLPSVRGAGPSTALLGCADVFHPQTWSGGETVAVTTYAMTAPADRRTVGITATGQSVYSSADRLYVAATAFAFEQPSTDRTDPGISAEPDSDIVGRIAVAPREVTTNLHAFALDGTATTYAGSGHVDGTVRDRWSLDEYDGRLRVAWTTIDKRGRTDNGLSVLTERDGRLVVTGKLRGLGRNENIQAVRWFDELAIMVTFRQIDPLYTIDLSDQDNPRTRGELKIPGYSGYLHPIGDDLLLGLGIDASAEGRSLGAQAAVFDISDRTAPVRVSQARFGPETALPAVDDPRGFTWLPGARTGVTPLAAWGTGDTSLKALEVSSTGQLRTRTVAALNQDGNVRTLALPDGRIAVLDRDRVRLLQIS